VGALVLSMIESSEISAQISFDGTVTFSDPPSQFSKADVDRVLQQAQEQAALLSRLEMEMARSKDYLGKAVKSRDESTWGPAPDEEPIFPGSGSGSSNWMEDGMFS